MFNLVVKPTTIGLPLTLAMFRKWKLCQLDVNKAFLQGNLEEVYRSQPPGYVDSKRPSYVSKLNKVIYGLQQTPRAWYN